MKTFKSLLALIVTISATGIINAQVGIGTITPQGALDITSATDGLLIPRVALTSTLVVLPVITGTESELVYNTSTTGDVTPGYYYLSTAIGPWVRIGGTAPVSDAWLITGNTNIVDGTNFLGTGAATNVDVAFRRNNLAAGRISTTSTSFGLGAQATAPTSVGITAIGYNALNRNTAGGLLNTAVGYRALETNSTGDNNTAFGYETLLNNNGEGNTGVGGAALNRNTIGNFNTAVGHVSLYFNNGSNNTAVGYRSLVNNSTGASNVAVGSFALEANTTTRFNIAIGHTALAANRGERNIGIGFEALSRITSGSAQDNVAIGYQSMDFATGIANRNVAIGAGTLRFVNAGTQNVAVGHDAGSSITSGNNNIAIGISAQVPSATASNQLSIGNWIYGNSGNIGIGAPAPNGALEITSTNNGLLIPRIALSATTTVTVTTPVASELVYNTATAGDVTPGYYYLSAAAGPWVRLASGGAPTGSWLTAGNAATAVDFLGTTNDIDLAFRRNNLAAGKIGATSTSIGVGALSNASPGNQNTAVGVEALNTNTGTANTAYGYQAAAGNAGASRSVAIGFQAMQNNTANDNTALGFQTMSALSNSDATFNVAIGFQSMQNSNTSTTVSNTFIGRQAGLSASGGHNVGIGATALGINGVNSGNDNIAIGSNAGFTLSSGSNNILIGRNAQTAAASTSNSIVIGAGTVGTAYVNAPSWTTSSDRRLKTDIKDSPLGLDFIKTIRPVSYARLDNINKETEFGFIAQELETALSNAGVNNHGIVSETANGMLAVRYNDFLPMTIKAVQEQQVLIEKLQKDNEELKAINAAILKRLEALENKN